MDIIEELKTRDGKKKAVKIILALNFFAFATLLFMGANGSGPVYDLLKPDVVNEYYLLNSQEIGNISVDGTDYTDILLFHVVPLDSGLNKARGEEILYFANEDTVRKDLENDKIIVCTWVIQKTGEGRIVNVISYDQYMLWKESGIDFTTQ